MEIIIAVAVFGFGLWWLFLRKPADITVNTAPYKVETPEVKSETLAVSTGDGLVLPELAPLVAEVAPVAVEEAVAPAPLEPTPVKKPRKPRAPKVVAEKPAAKKAAPVKKAAAIKAAPKKPRSKKA